MVLWHVPLVPLKDALDGGVIDQDNECLGGVEHGVGAAELA